MVSRNKIRIPQEIREDKPEHERKYSIIGHGWGERVGMLQDAFNHVAGCTGHFATLDQRPHIDDYPADLAPELPVEIIAPRTRYYWAAMNLKGYRATDKLRGEVRTEEKAVKDAWQQVLKLGGGNGRTLSRGEYKRLLDGFGVNLDVYKDQRAQAYDTLGRSRLKPLVRLQGQTKKVYYHPDGDRKTLLEIKFDKVKGETFDGFKRDIVEIEVEVKRSDKTGKHGIEAILDLTERELFRHFADSLTPIYHSKVDELFQHLYGWQLADKKEFQKAFKALPVAEWKP